MSTSTSTSTSTTKKVLAIGLKAAADTDPSHGFWDPERVQASVREQGKLATQAGFQLQTFVVDVAQADDVNVEQFRARLREEKWDGVSIGFGVRGNEAYTPLFENLVNAVAEEVRPLPKFIFPLRPSEVWTNVSRVFGVDQAAQA